MRLSRNTFLVGGASLVVFVSRFVLRARMPDDYDSIGFVLALDDFDLARFQPHFPGYPVYVALGKLVHTILGSPLESATAVSAAASAITAVGVWLIVRRLANQQAAWCALGLYSGAALPWILGSSALSDGTATALAVSSFAALIEDKFAVSGFLLALMLGARASYFPLAFSWLAIVYVWRRRHLAPACCGAALGLASWAIPFIALVRPRTLVNLGRVHLLGHFTDWGGSVTTRPDLRLRLFAFVRDLFYDGLAPRLWTLGALAVIFLLARPIRVPTRQALLLGGIVFLPYAFWALLGQNVVDQPRHLLPPVVLLTIVLGCMLHNRSALAVAAVTVVFAASTPLAVAHARTIPAAAQATEYVVGHYAQNDVAVFGGRAVRFFRYLTPSLVTRERTWLSEVDVDLERLNVLPRHVLITSEVEPDPRRARRLKKGPTFCRDARLDRMQPCLQILEYALGQGSAP